jgi:hypothetical protein
MRITSYSSSFSTTMLQSVTSAAMAPIAAQTGRSAAPTRPSVSGTSIKAFPSSFLMMRRRMLPSCTSYFAFASKLSPLTLYSSVRTFSSVIVSSVS